MFGQTRDKRWPGRGPGAFTIGAVAAAAVAITSAAWPMSGSLAATHPLSRTATAGHGQATSVFAAWVPVPYQRAQLNVPGQWLVETSDRFFCPSKHGSEIFAGLKPRFPKQSSCHLAASFAWIVAAGHVPAGITHRKPTAVINGLPVYRVPSADHSVVYLVPRLGVRVGAHGRIAKRILATLSRSPLAVVLAKGPVSAVPAYWVKRQFGGVKFATPRRWPVQRETQWATCRTGVLRLLQLINAKKPPAALPCPFPYPSAGNLSSLPGLTVVTGKFAAKSVAETYPNCQVRHGTRICLSAETGVGGLFSGVLIFSVSKPHQHARTFLLLGLAGSGAQARTVFDSITVR